MKIMTNRVTWGLLLIAFGALFLLQNLGLLPESGMLWAIVFGSVGVVFLIYFLTGRQRWWAAIPGFGFLGIGGTVLLSDVLSGNIPSEWVGAFFLGMLATGFFVVYLRLREHWWPVIPSGALYTISAIILLTGPDREPDASRISLALFGGLALTFLLLAILPAACGRARWAIWPATGLLIAAFFAGASAFDLLNLVVPAALIIGGIFVLVRGLR